VKPSLDFERTIRAIWLLYRREEAQRKARLTGRYDQSMTRAVAFGLHQDMSSPIPGMRVSRYFYIRLVCCRPKWVCQRGRLYSGSNQPPLTHHPGCSPSAQAPSLSSSDNLIMWSPIGCPAMFFSSTLNGDAQVPSFGTQGGPK
jgi:hypothetical protein